MKNPCPICGKRNAERFCPAKGEKICAVCCGREREVTIDCPSGCTWLAAARRYERERPRSHAPESLSFPDVDIPRDFILGHEEALLGLMTTIRRAADESRLLRDADAIQAIRALAETFRTLQSGILFERPPDAPLPREVYSAMAQFIQEFRQAQQSRGNLAPLKDHAVFLLLVFLLRLAEISTNGRPLSRGFLDSLRETVAPTAGGAASGQSQLQTHSPSHADSPRIIIP